jgi:transcriptional regulator with XRE-family HTH domain
VNRPVDEATLRQQVGRRIYLRRVWLDLTQQEVADRGGISRNFVSAIERGAQGLDAWRLWQVAEALGATLDWVLRGPDDGVTKEVPGRLSRHPQSHDGPEQWT